MKILITGAGFANKGAEAMLRTVQEKLARRLPSVEFILWRPPITECRLVMSSGLKPFLLPFESTSSKWQLVADGLKKKLWTLLEYSRLRNLEQIACCFNKKTFFNMACSNYLCRNKKAFDAVIDISGFAYGDVWGISGFQRIKPVIEYCRMYDKNTIFLPQAWGPFDTPIATLELRRLLNNQNTIFYSRDETSSRYLERALDIRSGVIESHPDIVFGFHGSTPARGEQILRDMGCSLQRPIVGIAPNMRVYERVAGKGTGNLYLQTLSRLIIHCLDNFDIDVVLQANEVDESGNNADDRYLCSLIMASVNRPDRCFMTRDFLSAESTKALISHFELLVGSRFHSLVFAFSLGVPAMAVSWSHKYQELFSLFDMGDNVYECQNIDSGSLISMFDRLWRDRQFSSRLIFEKASQLCSKVEILFDEVAARLCERNI